MVLLGKTPGGCYSYGIMRDDRYLYWMLAAIEYRCSVIWPQLSSHDAEETYYVERSALNPVESLIFIQQSN